MGKKNECESFHLEKKKETGIKVTKEREAKRNRQRRVCKEIKEK